MTIEERLVGLYPAAFRQVWGPDLLAEARAAGWLSWPDLIRGAIDLWLHPATWPAHTPAQRRARAASMAVALALTGWLVGHAVVEQDAPIRVAGRELLDAATVLLAIGLVLVMPAPRIAACGAASRLLTPPTVLGAGAVAVANLADPAALGGLGRATVLACWWAALGLGVVQACRLVRVMGSDTEPPSAVRLRAGLRVVAFAACAGAFVAGLPDGVGGPDPVLGAGALLLLAATCLSTTRDVPATG